MKSLYKFFYPYTWTVFIFGLLLITGYSPIMIEAVGQEQNKLPFDGELRQQIKKTFYQDNTISLEKIAVFRKAMEKRYLEVRQNLKNVYQLKDGMSPARARKKLEGRDHIVSYKLLLSYIDNMARLSSSADTTSFDRLAVMALELEDALKVFGLKLNSTFLFERVPESFKRRKIPIHLTPWGEASNLWDPDTGLYYSQGQLKQMKQEGKDVSRLNPGPESTFWQPHDISKIDVISHFQQGNDPLHKGLKIYFPKSKAFFKKVRKTQSKPKLDIFIRNRDGKKINFKMKIGREMHSEPTVAALYTALGFSADISKHVKDFKLVLGKTTPYQFKIQWNEYYAKYDVNKYIKKEGSDKEGHYIIFHEGLLEAKPKKLLRIGPWSYSKVGHRGLREVRGSLIFNMWVSNIDLKDSENNKLILRKINNKKHFFHIQHDMGFAFGKTYIERPGDFNWNLIKKKTDDYIHLSYRCFQKNSFKHITYADARWMVRLIAQLSRKQLEDAMDAGGWPKSLGLLLVEKLINRRNQLVKAFGLEGDRLVNDRTIAFMPVNRNLTTDDGVVVNGKLKIYYFDGYTQYFGPRVREVIPMWLRSIRNLVVNTSVNALSTIRYLKIDPQWFGLPENLMTRGVYRTNREIQLNPTPTGEDDQYLVKDTMQLGFRFGYGDAITGDFGYIRKYTVVSPVRTMNQARFFNHFIINLMLQDQVKSFGTQRKFVAMVEDFYELRTKARLGGLGGDRNSILGASAAASKFLISRRFVSNKKPGQLIYFEEKGHYRQMAYKIFLEFAMIFHYRISLFKRIAQKGHLTRNYYSLDITDQSSNPKKRFALNRLLLEDDPTAFKTMGVRETITDNFTQVKTKLNLFGAYKLRSIYRVDKLRPGVNASNKKKSEKKKKPLYFQVESHQKKSWRFVDNGEDHASSVSMTAADKENNQLQDPLLKIALRIDDFNARDGELKKAYLNFINTVALDPFFIDFDSSAHTQNRHWGYLQLYLNIYLYQEAIEKLLNLKAGEIWAELAVVTGHSVKGLKQQSRPVYIRGLPVYNYNSARGSNYLACKADYLIRALKKARAGKSLKRIRYLVKAVRKAVYTSGHSFEPALLTVLHKLLGGDHLFFEASITMPAHKEMVFPEHQPLYNQRGTKRNISPLIFKYIFEDPAEIYHLF